MENRPPRILYVIRDDGGCGFYRCRQPAEYIRRMGLAEVDTVMNRPTPDQMMWADLVVMQEMGSTTAMENIRFCIENKIPFISELDDFIHHVSPNNAGGYGAWNPGTLYIQRACEQMRKSFGMTVSTNWLAREYFPYNSNIFVVPNYLDKEKWSNPIPVKNDGKIRIGWSGGNAHVDDLKTVSKVIDRIVKESDGKVVFETIGMQKVELIKVFDQQDFTETCPKCGYEGEIHNHPGESQDNYPLILASKGWDIAIAPVIDNGFGNAKSDLKLKEYAAIGAAPVASRVAPYEEASQDGCRVSLATTYEEWYNAIDFLLKNKDIRDEYRKKNREWVSRYWIQDNAQKVFEVYTHLLARVPHNRVK